MAKVLMLPLPAYSHINLTLPLAQELLARGEEVSYCLPEEFKPAIAATGAAFVPYQLSGKGVRWRRLSCEDLFFWQPLHEAVFSQEALPQLLPMVRAETPDYLIYDGTCLWGRLLSHILHLPAVRFVATVVLHEQLGPIFAALLEQAERASMPLVTKTPFAESEQQVTFRSAVEQLCATYRLPPISLQSFYHHAERLNLVAVPRVFQPGAERFDERFQFVGPIIVPQPEATDFPPAQLQGQPTLYISMGSICNHEVEFFKTCFAAFGRAERTTKQPRRLLDVHQREGEQPWQVILATGTSNPAALGVVPENFVARPFVPQLAVLQQATVFVTHGGMNSVVEALSSGVPLVVVPQMMEHVIIARRVAELGLGITLEKSAVTAASLKAAVTRVASDQEMHQRVRQMREELRQVGEGGVGSAADAVLRFSRAEGQKGWSWPSRVAAPSVRKERARQAKVFGIGLSRTGTTSLTQALQLLGYQAIHFPRDDVTRAEVYRFFASPSASLSLALLQQADALTDTPVCCLYKALDQAYPGSKFILTVREKQAWLASYQGHWRRYPFLFSERPDGFLAHYSHFLNERLYGTQSADPEILSAAYDRYTAEVFEYFRDRPEDLLILDISSGQGWNELAPFLERAIPQIPFPWENRGLAAPDEVQTPLLSHEVRLC